MNAVSPAFAAATHPDAVLLALGDRFKRAAEAEQQAWDKVIAGVTQDDDPEWQTAQRLNDVSGRLADEVLTRPASTPEGLAVALRALLWAHGDADPMGAEAVFNGPILEPGTGRLADLGDVATDVQLAISIINTMMKLGPEVFEQQPAASDLAFISHPHVLADAPEPDAVLIALCREFCANEAAIFAIYEDSKSSDEAATASAAPLEMARVALIDQMEPLRATAPAGIVARAMALSGHSGIKPGYDSYTEVFDPAEPTETGRLLHMLLRDTAQGARP